MSPRGNRHKLGYPKALRDYGLTLLKDRKLTYADIGRRLVNFAQVNYGLAIEPVPRSTLRTWAKAAGRKPRRPGRPRGRAA